MKIRLIFLFAVCIWLSSFLFLSPKALACSSLDSSKGTASFKLTIPADNTYRLWARVYSPVAGASRFYMSVGTKYCGISVAGGQSVPKGLSWVNFQNADKKIPITLTLTQGSLTVTVAGQDPSVGVDSILLTTDDKCVPSGNGSNCVPDSGSVKGSGPNTTYTVDGKPTTGPEIDTSQLSNGDHLVQVTNLNANGSQSTTSHNLHVNHHPLARYITGIGAGAVIALVVTIAIRSAIRRKKYKKMTTLTSSGVNRSTLIQPTAGYSGLGGNQQLTGQGSKQMSMISKLAQIRGVQAIVFMLVFVCVGYVLIFSYAATPHVVFRLSNAQVNSPAKLIDLKGSSTGKIVQFSSGAQQGQGQPATEVGFDSDHLSCSGSHVEVDETFSLKYTACRSQLINEVQSLAQHNVRVIRIWPIVSQFFVHEPRDPQNLTYDDHLNATYIANFDDFLNVLKQNHMQAMVGLNAHTDCDVKNGVPNIHDWMRFNYSLFYDPSNPNLLPSYLNGLKLFAQHYRNNTVIRSYDLMNEVNNQLDEVLTDYSHKQAFWTRCLQTTPPDHDTLRDNVYNTLRQIRDTIKAVDSLHSLTFSLGSSTADKIQNNLLDPGFMAFIKVNSDYYDFHAYVHLPNAGPNVRLRQPKDWFNLYFPSLPTGKPVILGEIGIDFDSAKDPDGRRCEQTIGDSHGQFTLMNDWCQAAYLLNNQQFVAEAATRGIKAIYFHSAWEHNGYVYETYDAQKNPSGFGFSSGASYLFDYDKQF